MNQSKLPQGVYKAYKKNGELYYRASVTSKTKHISLGSYETPEAAHRAYLEANLMLHDKGMNLLSYKTDSQLPFEKWVVLINFRDNGIYFSNPIYVRQKLFYYYLSPSLILKFDIDDLFYFSSHKIMVRGNHYFVADYGMQVNIAGRFDIKNYAVINRDYRFINGDTTDFRRENIQILNTFHGVVAKKSLKDVSIKDKYYSYIHIRGNYLIGIYDTALEAAIAYNKAIDVVTKKGVKKNFTPNYIEGLSPSKYAELYTKLEISSRLLNYKNQ